MAAALLEANRFRHTHVRLRAIETKIDTALAIRSDPSPAPDQNRVAEQIGFYGQMIKPAHVPRGVDAIKEATIAHR